MKTSKSNQLTLEIAQKTQSRVIASSYYNFQIELMEKVGEEDIPNLIFISEHLVEEFTDSVRLTKTSIRKYFNYPETLPFIARHNKEIIGYIIGAPLEYFMHDPSFQCDDNIGENNTLYTYAFVIMKKYKGNGYGKTLKRVYLSWAKKKGFYFVSGHVQEGISEKFSGEVQVLFRFKNWHGTSKTFEYYRRSLTPGRGNSIWSNSPQLASKV